MARQLADSVMELAAYCADHGLEAVDLDELVHDEASKVASEINNDGLESQLRYLVDAWGVEETRQALIDLVSDANQV